MTRAKIEVRDVCITYKKMQRTKDRLNRFNTVATTCIKCVKRKFTGTGEMMQHLNEIEQIYISGDIYSLRNAYITLKESWPHSWSPQYHKHLQLILLCQFLLVQNPKEKSAARWRLEKSLDDSHEVSRRIRLLITPPPQS